MLIWRNVGLFCALTLVWMLPTKVLGQVQFRHQCVCVPACPPAYATFWCEPIVHETIVEETTIAAVEEEDSAGIVSAIHEEEPEEDEEIVTEFLNDEESHLDPVAFRMPPMFTLNNMALDWGVANIGAGTLYPQNNALPGFGGFGGFFSPQDDNNDELPPGGNSIVLMPPPPIIIMQPGCFCWLDWCGKCFPHHCSPPITPGSGNPVPEPTTWMIWGLGFTSFAIWRRKKKLSPSIQQPS